MDYTINPSNSKGTIDRILSLLDDVRETSNGWTARCPAHNDHNPSLSINIGSDGRILLHCFAGCSIEDICSELGIEIQDLFQETGDRRREAGSRSEVVEVIRDTNRELRVVGLNPQFAIRNPKSNFDDVYSSLIAHLSLEERHKDHLRERGLSDEEIELLEERGYSTLPADIHDRIRIVRKLRRNERSSVLTKEDLLQTPGFYEMKSGCVAFVGFGGGLFLPVRNAEGMIVGAQVRVDDPERFGVGKYVWFSASRYGGVKAETRTHVAMPVLEEAGDRKQETGWRRVWITEGVLKADISALKLEEPVLGIPGVTTWKADDILRSLWTLGAEEVIIAFDADLRENESVKAQRDKLASELLKYGYRTLIAEWEIEEGKGLDDLLVAGGYPRIKPFRPVPDLSKLRTDQVRQVKVEAKVKMTDPLPLPLPLPLKVTPELIEELRQDMAETARSYILNPGDEILLIRGFQGVGKTTTTLQVAGEIYRETQGALRPIYVAPRHDLLDQAGISFETGVKHIMPRAPRDEHDTPRCPLWKVADKIAAKRHSVVKNLCLTGACGHDPSNCPYYRQFTTSGPTACVYEIATNEKLMEEKLLKSAPANVVIFDEPDLSRLIERVHISQDDIHNALKWASPKNIRLLSELNLACAKLAITMKERAELRLIGRQALDALVEAMGGNEKLNEILSEASGASNPQKAMVPVEIEDIDYESERSIRVYVDGAPKILPSSAVEIVNSDLILAERWLVEKHGLHPAFKPMVDRDLEKIAEELPLNFVSDLLDILRHRRNNLTIRLKPNGEVELTLILLKRPSIPKGTPVIVLDPDMPAELLEAIFNRPVRVWQAPKPETDTEIIQVLDGRYGHHTLLHPHTGEETSSADRLKRIALAIAKGAPEDTLLITWKGYADKLREAQKSGEIPLELAVEHYGALEGQNEYVDRCTVILMGAPQGAPIDIIEMALAVYPDKNLDLSSTERWVSFNYQDVNGSGYEVRITDFADERLRKIAAFTRECEIVQCARRIRDTLSPGKRIYLLTNLPIEELPPSQLVTLEELAERLDVDLSESRETVREIVRREARRIIEEEIRAAQEQGRTWQRTVNGLAVEVWRSLNCQNPLGYHLVKLLNFKTVRRYVREALIEIERELRLKRIKVVLTGNKRGGRRFISVWSTSIRINRKIARREHLYARQRLFANTEDDNGDNRDEQGISPMPEGTITASGEVTPFGDIGPPAFLLRPHTG